LTETSSWDESGWLRWLRTRSKPPSSLCRGSRSKICLR